MTGEERPRRLLSSWKEVAAYLGCDKRTCYRWEKSLGLPVRRVEGASRSRIFAYADEIDRWREARLGIGNGSGERRRKGALARFLPIAAFLAVALLAAALVLPKLAANRTPSDFHIRGSVLSILDDRGRELWHYRAEAENLVPESAFRRHFQIKRKAENGDRDLPWIAFRDLDADGRPEVLFSTHTVDELGEGELLCFDHKGRLRWRFDAGRAIRFGDTLFSGDFSVPGFDISDLEGDGREEILLVAHQQHRFPTRLAVLDADGKLRGEFWNSGQINDIGAADLDGDGRKELIVAGLNNEYRTGFIALFDPSEVAGCSPQTDRRYICPELSPGTMKRYARNSPCDVTVAMGFTIEGFRAFEVLKNRHLTVDVVPTDLIYEFGPGLDIVDVQASHSFERKHGMALREGKISSVLDRAYFDTLKRGVLYWTGSGWSPGSGLNL